MMQAGSSAVPETSGPGGHSSDRARSGPLQSSREALRGALILLGVSWEFSKFRGPSAPHGLHLLPRRLAVAFASLSVLVAGLAPAAALGTSYDPASDPYSMANTTLLTGAASWWNAGYTGSGVDVALIDTGVTPVPGLDAPGKVIYGPDLSLESQAPNFRNLDTNGHGTFMAGLIAGRDASLSVPYSAAPASVYRGMAPDARLVSIKVGVADGGVDVSQVVAAIDWVVQHRYDNGMNIRVISLAYGTNTTQSYSVDPLAYAAEQAWKRGIVVVAAAGNSGYQRGSGAPGLANPAYDPYLIGVGGSDSMGTVTMADDMVGTYSAVAAIQGARRPDFVAPGSHLQGLRVPNSWIDLTHPGGILDGRYFRGSGTSQAAAITSGAVALLLQRYPKLNPDQVKAFLAGNASKLSDPTKLQGDGEINLQPMLTAALPYWASQAYLLSSTGAGSLELARGTDHLTDDGVVLTGEQDIFGHPFDSVAMAALGAAAASWSGGTWNGNVWTGEAWSGNSWSGNSWSGNSWSGNSWSGNSWSGNSWSGNSWSTGGWL